jgi:Tetratricopeptide repeat
MTSCATRTVFAVLLPCVLASALTAAVPSQKLREEASRLFAAGDWARAAEAYRAVVGQDPGDGASWVRLGVALNRTGQWRSALDAFARADALGVRSLSLFAGAGFAHARLGQVDEAFVWLERAVEAGLPDTVLTGERTPEAVRRDPRFPALVAKAEALSHPCRHGEAYRAFDFWVGDWDVTSGGRPAGTNHIEKAADGCLLVENWTSVRGGHGKSLNFYDRQRKVWRQIWVDGRGDIIETEGGFSKGAMRLKGTHRTPRGDVLPFRMTFTPRADGSVRQFIEESSDGGKTWSVWFDGNYVRSQGGT